MDGAPVNHRHVHRSRFDIVCLAVIDWDFRFQRPQQLMRELARQGHRVFYISPNRFAEDPTIGSCDTENLVPCVTGVRVAQTPVERPFGPYRSVIDPGNTALALSSIETLRVKAGLSNGVIIVQFPFWTPVALAARERWAWPVVYDCMDDWEVFPGMTAEIVESERDLVNRGDLTVVSSGRLERKWLSTARRVRLIRNGGDAAFIRSRCQPNARLSGIPHPIVGFFGAIAHWFDVALVEGIARARPRYQFVLVGEVFNLDLGGLVSLPNVHLVGAQPYETIPEFLHHFDCCMLPFLMNTVTAATDPIKLYEYLTPGKPVVTVPLPELDRLDDLIYVAQGAEAFAAAIDRALAEPDGDLRLRRIGFAEHETWTQRAQDLFEALRALADDPA